MNDLEFARQCKRAIEILKSVEDKLIACREAHEKASNKGVEQAA